MRVIGIDPGTKTGVAWTDSLQVDPIQSAVWDLTPPKYRRGLRPLALRLALEELMRDHWHDASVFYELVQGQKSLYAAQCYGCLVGVIESVCEEHDVPYLGIHTSAVKIRATGKGNAPKDAVLDAAESEFGHRFKTSEHDRADACYILQCGLDALKID